MFIKHTLIRKVILNHYIITISLRYEIVFFFHKNVHFDRIEICCYRSGEADGSLDIPGVVISGKQYSWSDGAGFIPDSSVGSKRCERFNFLTVCFSTRKKKIERRNLIL